jgi:hypothetical protein
MVAQGRCTDVQDLRVVLILNNELARTTRLYPPSPERNSGTKQRGGDCPNFEN